MKIKLTFVTVIGLLLLGTTNVKAQADISNFTPSHLAAAQKLIATTGMTDARFTAMRDNTIKTVSKSVPEKNREKFIAAMIAFMNKYLPVDGFKDVTAKMYAKIFTEAELNQLIDFYNSPIGKKITSSTPELMQNMMLMDHQILVNHGDELQSIINDSVKE